MTSLDQAIRDFADQRRAEQTAEIIEDRFRALADALPQIVWTARPDGFMEYHNARWYEYAGFSRGADGDESWTEVLHPDDVQPCLHAWQRAVRTASSFQVEYRLRDHRGERYRWHLGRAFPLKDEDGRVTRWFGTWTDIHDQKEAIRVLEERATAFREADRRKDEFLAVLAHELRNPLASIVSAVALLRTDEGEGRAWAAEVISRQTGQLTRLIDDLLDVSRINSGKIRLRKESLDLATVLDSAVEAAHPAITEHRHEFLTEYPRHQLFLEGDPARLEQIVVNLLTNAAKYTPSGGHLALHASRRDSQIVVSIRDDGVGIPSEKLPEIFELFAQGERSIARSKGGLGIGLSLVRKLVELHGGSVSAESEGPGMGSEFTVQLPAIVAPVITPLQPGARVPSAEPSRARVLVVDDHNDSADTLARLLRRRGYQAKVAYDGPSAFTAARVFEPDVILLDIDLPELTGCEVADRLRQDPAHQNCLLIAVTGYGQDEDRKRCEEAGFDHHLLKPVDLELLHRLISDFLSERSQGDLADITRG